MLMRFSINNFMSFPYREDKDGRIQAEEFSLYAGRTEQFKERVSRFQDRKVLKFAAVYGANAAGKSNLMKAIDAGRKIIVSGAENLDLKDKYCRNIEINKEKQTLFEYEFSTNEKCFAYGFTINLWKQKILTEWLVELENQKERTIYERDAETEEYYFDEKFFHEEESKRQFLFYIEDSNRIESTLLLRELARRKLNKNDFELFYNVFHWFDRSLIIIYPNTRLGEGYFRFDNDNVELVKLLDYLDTGITGYKLQDLNENAFREYFTDSMLADELLKSTISEIRTVLKYNKTLFELFFAEKGVEKISKLLFRHGKDENYYEYGEESDGTQRLIELLEVILNDDGEKTFIIDELDRSMHPQMTKKFVETFFDFSKNKHTQLIITTHESYLMDLNLLRRDEIWFAERESNCTTLYSLEKFKIRYDKVVSKDYLIGRYGAVPVFKDFDYVWGRAEN